MRIHSMRPAMAQQAPTATDLLIWAQLLSLFGNWLRSGAGRFLDFFILLLSL